MTTKAEQETTLRWAADEDVVSILTAHLPTRRKLERSGYQPYPTSTVHGESVGWFYRVPLAELRWRVGARKRAGRPMTEAQRAGLARARVARDSWSKDKSSVGSSAVTVPPSPVRPARAAREVA
jgi:hypothetical protein